MKNDFKADYTNKALIQVKCFGSFEVFNKEGIVRFSRSRSKEALAYLIDRRGSGCTVSELCVVLWEDRYADKNLKSQCRVIMASLKKDLEAAGAGDVLIKGWNSWSVDTGQISCDYYDFLNNDISAIRSFAGEYMGQYSWAEMTLSGLCNIANMIAASAARKVDANPELSIPELRDQIKYLSVCLRNIERMCSEDPGQAAAEARLLSDYLDARLSEMGGDCPKNSL